MSIFLAMLLSQAKILPEVDRRALEIQARVEASQPRRAAQPERRPTLAATTQRPQVRRASGGASLDLSAITTICRAAGGQEDPAQFLSTLARAYSLSSDESARIRTSCAAYLAGRADARRR
ncbi:MAG: hypothetical protein JWL74_1382 [Alphaproteobacteria bacterium]|nr:hypothetical protein [Alphaproteobacteria bacterium]